MLFFAGVILLVGMGAGFCLPERLDHDSDTEEEKEDAVFFGMFFKNKRAFVCVITFFLTVIFYFFLDPILSI